MSTVTISPLRQRMIEDMNARKLCAGTQRGHIRSCKQFAGFLKRSPDTTTAEDIRRFQLHLSETGISICNMGCSPTATDPETLRTRASCSPCRRAQKNPRRPKLRSNNPARCRVHARAAAAA